jgi:hypothetical protein
MKALAIAVAMTAVSAGAAQAADWVFMSRTDDALIGLDLSSVRSSYPSSTKTFWTVKAHAETQTTEGRPYDFLLARYVISCSSETLDLTNIVTYALTSPEAVTTDVVTDPPNVLIPDSIGYHYMEIVCNNFDHLIGSGSSTAEEFARKTRDLFNGEQAIDLTDEAADRAAAAADEATLAYEAALEESSAAAVRDAKAAAASADEAEEPD